MVLQWPFLPQSTVREGSGYLKLGLVLLPPPPSLGQGEARRVLGRLGRAEPTCTHGSEAPR